MGQESCSRRFLSVTVLFAMVAVGGLGADLFESSGPRRLIAF